MAVRIASSLVRPADRARRRFATLTQARIRTRNTVASMERRMGLVSPPRAVSVYEHHLGVEPLVRIRKLLGDPRRDAGELGLGLIDG